MKFQIKNRWSGAVQFECELSAEMAGGEYALQLGFAIKRAIESDSNLRGSNLSGSNLRGSNLSDSDLSGLDLSGSDLSGSDLRGSNLSGSNLSGSNLSGSNLRGSNLSGSNLSGSNLSGSNLRGSNLSGSNLRGSNLSDSDLSGSDLSGSNLSGSDLRGSDLSGSNLSDSDLSGSDLRGSDLSGSGWMPRVENIHQAVYTAASAPQALDMGSWHLCETTHCRAGWVVHLAGAPGRVLEGCLGTPAAAALIYQASDPSLEKIPDFYCSNTTALADMKRLADAEAAAVSA
jgi:uncharacterized protein YjbI with pentapeptide repeats